MSTDAFSGAEQVNFTIIENLKDKYDFHWVSRRGSINGFLEERGIKWIEIESLSVKEIKRVIREYKPDILHATDYRASVITALSCKNTPLVSHLHNNSPWLKKLCPNSLALLLAAWKSRKILAVSDSIEKEYIFSSAIKNKIINISNPVSCNRILKCVTEESQKEYDICCVGRLTEAKNPLRFLDIAAEIRNIIPELKVLWIGDGELEGAFLKKIDALSLGETVTHMKFQNNPYVHMAKSKMFLLASRWEGYGLVAFEALTLGLPCIVSNMGGLPEIVNDKCGRLCNENSEFVSLTTELLQNPNLLEEYSKEAVLRAHELENIDEYMNTLKKIYN